MSIPVLPTLNYGVIKDRFPRKKRVILWAFLTSLLASLLVITINSSFNEIPLGFTFGNRENWSFGELFFGILVSTGFPWFIYSCFVWEAPDYEFNSNVRDEARKYSTSVIKPWVESNYDIKISDSEAFILYEGNRIGTYRNNEKGECERVTVELCGIYEIQKVALGYTNYQAVDDYHNLRLIVIPSPTTPPAPYEFYSVENKSVRIES